MTATDMDRLDLAIAFIQGQISQLQRRMRQLQTSRNALAPLCRLPAEVMVNIAEFAIACDWKTRQIYPDRDEVWSWRDGRTRVSSICSQVRSVVLSAQRLWAYVDLSQSSEWNHICVERARMVPLDVFYEEEGEETREYRIDPTRRLGQRAKEELSLGQSLQAILPQAERVELHVSGLYTIAPRLETMLCHPSLPRLRSLEYVVASGEPADDYFHDPGQFLRGAPLLTQLVLGGLGMPVSTLCLPSLIRLELWEVSITESPATMIAFLDRSPALQHLHLQINYDRNYHDNSDNSGNGEVLCDITRPTRLSSLRTLYIHTALSFTMAHLTALPTPSEELCVRMIGRSHQGQQTNKALHEEVFSYLWPMFCVELPGPIAMMGDVSVLGRPVKIEIDHPGINIGRISYSYYDKPIGMYSILNRVHSIQLDLREREGLDLFELLKQFRPDRWNPLSDLLSVHHIIFNTNAHCGGLPSHQSLIMWLQARVFAGRRLRLLDFRGAQASSKPSWSCRQQEDEETKMARLLLLAGEMAAAGLVDEVLVEGKPTIASWP
jgi:hypothetical protein